MLREVKVPPAAVQSSNLSFAHMTPREMAGHLYAMDKGSTISPQVQEHLQTCASCQEDWDFLRRTDPILRQHHERTVQLVIQRVLDDEASEVVDINAAEELADEERLTFADELERKLSTRAPVHRDELIQEIKDLGKPLSVDRIFEIIAFGQGMAEEQVRLETAALLAQAFEDRFSKEEALGQIPIDSVDRMIHLVQSNDRIDARNDESVELAEPDVDLYPMVLLFATLPKTFSFSPSFLIREQGHVSFKPELFSLYDVTQPVAQFEAVQV